jgi:hypothetical protein
MWESHANVLHSFCFYCERDEEKCLQFLIDYALVKSIRKAFQQCSIIVFTFSINHLHTLFTLFTFHHHRDVTKTPCPNKKKVFSCENKHFNDIPRPSHWHQSISYWPDLQINMHSLFVVSSSNCKREHSHKFMEIPIRRWWQVEDCVLCKLNHSI